MYAEARLIDEKRLEEWYELYAEDGLYWMPFTRDQKSPTAENSLIYEDKLLLQVRIQRLRSPNAHSQAQPSWCQHVLQAPSIEDRGSISGNGMCCARLFCMSKAGGTTNRYMPASRGTI